jgi:serine/threonine-protein kinase
LTNDSLNYSAVWSADGSRIAYASYVAGSVDILSRPADLSAPATVLLSRENRKYPIAWTADDRLLFQEVSTATGGDIRVVDLKTQTIADIAATAADERNARLSPDARWVSYESNETGRFEVFVRPFGRPGGAIPVSTQGGNDPVWSPKGDELFYFDGKSLVAARVVTTPSFVVQSSVKLFNAPYEFGRIAGANYDITTDGKRFIMKPLPQVRPMQITLALNWAQEIDRIAPATRPE